VAIWFLLAIAYFGLAGRHKLVLSPEEEFALSNSAQSKPVA
jgi:ethanolamine permease